MPPSGFLRWPSRLRHHSTRVADVYYIGKLVLWKPACEICLSRGDVYLRRVSNGIDLLRGFLSEDGLQEYQAQIVRIVPLRHGLQTLLENPQSLHQRDLQRFTAYMFQTRNLSKELESLLRHYNASSLSRRPSVARRPDIHTIPPTVEVIDAGLPSGISVTPVTPTAVQGEEIEVEASMNTEESTKTWASSIPDAEEMEPMADASVDDAVEAEEELFVVEPDHSVSRQPSHSRQTRRTTDSSSGSRFAYNVYDSPEPLSLHGLRAAPPDMDDGDSAISGTLLQAPDDSLHLIGLPLGQDPTNETSAPTPGVLEDRLAITKYLVSEQNDPELVQDLMNSFPAQTRREEYAQILDGLQVYRPIGSAGMTFVFEFIQAQLSALRDRLAEATRHGMYRQQWIGYWRGELEVQHMDNLDRTNRDPNYQGFQCECSNCLATVLPFFPRDGAPCEKIPTISSPVHRPSWPFNRSHWDHQTLYPHPEAFKNRSAVIEPPSHLLTRNILRYLGLTHPHFWDGMFGRDAGYSEAQGRVVDVEVESIMAEPYGPSRSNTVDSENMGSALDA